MSGAWAPAQKRRPGHSLHPRSSSDQGGRCRRGGDLFAPLSTPTQTRPPTPACTLAGSRARSTRQRRHAPRNQVRPCGRQGARVWRRCRPGRHAPAAARSDFLDKLQALPLGEGSGGWKFVQGVRRSRSGGGFGAPVVAAAARRSGALLTPLSTPPQMRPPNPARRCGNCRARSLRHGRRAARRWAPRRSQALVRLCSGGAAR